MAVATPVFHSPSPVPAGAVCFRAPEPAKCINLQCDSHIKGRFVTEDPDGDGDICTTCGMKQTLGGGSLDMSKGFKEREDDDARAVDAARTSIQSRASGEQRPSPAIQLKRNNLSHPSSWKMQRIRPM